MCCDFVSFYQLNFSPRPLSTLLGTQQQTKDFRVWNSINGQQTVISWRRAWVMVGPTPFLFGSEIAPWVRCDAQPVSLFLRSEGLGLVSTWRHSRKILLISDCRSIRECVLRNNNRCCSAKTEWHVRRLQEKQHRRGNVKYKRLTDNSI